MTNLVAKPLTEYENMAEDWALPDALMGGTRSMRAAGKVYLPLEGEYVKGPDGKDIWSGETESAWQRRLDRTVLYNGYRKALQDLRGKVFAKPIIVDSISESFDLLMDDVDRYNRDLTAFAFDLFLHGVNYGLCHVLVDMDRLPVNATLAEARSVQARPYCSIIKPHQIIGWRLDDSGGHSLRQVRIRESIMEPDGEFGVSYIDQIRVIEPERIRIYQRHDDANMQEWSLYDEMPNGLGVVPLATFYTGRIAPMQALPPLLDLAYKNLEHWQSSSDQRNILHVARVPILFGAGFRGGSESFDVGASRALFSDDPQARLAYVEHSGSAIEAGAKDLEAIEAKMAQLALQPILQNTGHTTATARALDQSEANSVLESWALNLKDTIEYMLHLMGKWQSIEIDPVVTVHTDFTPIVSSDDKQILVSMRNIGDISRETLWRELKRRNTLSESFDAEAEIQQIEDEGGALLPISTAVMADNTSSDSTQSTGEIP